MNKKISLGTAIALIAVAVALAVTLTMAFSMQLFSAKVSDVNQRQALLDYLTEVDKQVREQYDGDVDEAGLREAVAAAYVGGIGDPYAQYLNADQYTKVQAKLSGEAEGFGLTVVRDTDGNVVVDTVDSGSPAAIAGLKTGMLVRYADDTALGTDMTTTELQDQLQTAGKIRLTVEQDGKEQSFSLVSATYELVTVTGELLEDSGIGYIRVSAFSDVTPKQFSAMVESLREQGASSYIFDVRGNTGGSLTAVREILAYLLPRGTYATLTKSGVVEELTSDGTLELTVPTATLINGSTMAEAELFAGVLSEQQKTTLVGATTNGCAMVQEYFAITSTNARIKLSTGQLALSIGGSWQGTGIKPTREVLAITAEGTDDMQLQAAVEALTTTATVNNSGM